VRNLKPEWWGSPLVQEKYQAEKACDEEEKEEEEEEEEEEEAEEEGEGG
jgi:hypothetical protein